MRGGPLQDTLTKHITAVDEPTVALGHSLGSIALVDVLALTSIRQEPLCNVRLLVPVGSQAPLLHKRRALAASRTPGSLNLRTRHFPAHNTYAQARLRLADYPALAARADYARSRMRICRGWLLNTMALALTADLAMLRYSFTHRPLILCATTLLGAMIAFGFYRAWRALTDTGYRKLAEQTTPAASPPIPAQPQPGAVPT